MKTITTNTHHTALEAKFIGATNTKGDRIKVKTLCSDSRSKTYNWCYDLNQDENYEAAVLLFTHELEWFGEWSVSITNTGCIAICTNRSN